MAYSRTTWEDLVTPLDADHMNNIEDGIAEAIIDDSVIEVYRSKGVVFDQLLLTMGEGETEEER